VGHRRELSALSSGSVDESTKGKNRRRRRERRTD
jgi:hypothetical protein